MSHRKLKVLPYLPIILKLAMTFAVELAETKYVESPGWTSEIQAISTYA